MLAPRFKTSYHDVINKNRIMKYEDAEHPSMIVSFLLKFYHHTQVADFHHTSC